jgi:hypothetical protein
MLQIISGKFFGEGKINEQESDAILFSNYSWSFPVKTRVAELRPADTEGKRVSSYVLRYTNRYQPRPQDIMVLAHPDQAIEQFRLLASFWFKSFFHVDRDHVELLCRPGPRHSSDTTIPCRFVPRFFDAPQQGVKEEADGFVAFTEKTLGMPRQQYNRLMACLGAFVDALEALGTSFDLAYSILVYLLEALSKSGGKYEPTWEDYDQNLRVRLDRAFSALDPKAVENIRSILLDNAHLKLKKRFVGFITTHIQDSFFTSEAEGRLPALRKNELQRALQNLYDTRSGYVHDLREVQEQLRVPWMGNTADVFHWNNEPYLTFAGLVRLSHHVLTSFVNRQPVLEREEYPWHDELPGRMQVELAPQYWVWQADGFTPSQAKRRFSGFLSYLADNLQKAPMPLLDLRQLMEKSEQLVHHASPEDRRSMLALYWIFNVMAGEEGRRPKWEELLSRFPSDFETCCIELIVLTVLIGFPRKWPLADWEAVYDEYLRSKHKVGAVNLPAPYEIAVEAELANLAFDKGEADKFDVWVDRAVLDASGRKEIQDCLRECKEKRQRINLRKLLGRPPVPEQLETPETTLPGTPARSPGDANLPGSEMPLPHGGQQEQGKQEEEQHPDDVPDPSRNDR